MKVLIINTVCGIRSTGRIVTDLADQYILNGDECRIAYGREIVPEKYKEIVYRIGSNWKVKYNALKARIFDNEGFNAISETKKFIEWANNYNPDILWLHNLHGYYINIELLFNWIKTRPHMEVKWTLHDCWAFTGHCAHFSYVKCDKWKSGCYLCEQTNEYPAGILFDNSSSNFFRKKRIFSGVSKMTVVTPSQWLAELVQKSFLGQYPVEVVHNTIDTRVFKPQKSSFRENYGLDKRIIVLGVASVWNERKGLKDFIDLSYDLDKEYQIVLVGLTNKEKKMHKIPNSVLCIEPINSKEELAEIYSAADIFLNLSKEETFGLTTIEALACGSYPIVYKSTACEEIVNCYGGTAVEQNSAAIIEAIHQIIK